jgi:hypothetical protein
MMQVTVMIFPQAQKARMFYKKNKFTPCLIFNGSVGNSLRYKLKRQSSAKRFSLRCQIINDMEVRPHDNNTCHGKVIKS